MCTAQRGPPAPWYCMDMDRDKSVELVKVASQLASLQTKQTHLESALRELTALQRDQEGLSKEAAVGAASYEAWNLCEQLKHVKDALDFFTKAVPVHVVTHHARLHPTAWGWVSGDSAIWETWDALHSYVTRADVVQNIVASWSTRHIDVTSAGPKPSMCGSVDLRRCTAPMWSTTVEHLGAQHSQLLTSIGQAHMKVARFVEPGALEELQTLIARTSADLHEVMRTRAVCELSSYALRAELGLPDNTKV